MGSKESRTKGASDISNGGSKDDIWLRSHAEQNGFEDIHRKIKGFVCDSLIRDIVL